MIESEKLTLVFSLTIHDIILKENLGRNRLISFEYTCLFTYTFVYYCISMNVNGIIFSNCSVCNVIADEF